MPERVTAETATVPVERRFALDEDILPGTRWARRVPYRNHGRQVTRNARGCWICTHAIEGHHRDRHWLALSVADAPVSQGSAFAAPIVLAGRADAIGIASPIFPCDVDHFPAVTSALDADDRLHVVYQQADGLYHTMADASATTLSETLSRVDAWQPPRQIAQAGSELGDVLVDSHDALTIVYTAPDGTLVEAVDADTTRTICGHGNRPSMHVDAQGVRHLAFECDRRVYYMRRQPGDTRWTDTNNQPSPELVAHFCASWPSLVTTRDGCIVIAYQGEGKVDLRRKPELYGKLRPAGGSTVSYAVHKQGRWQRHDLVRSSEILIKRKPAASLATRREQFVPRMEEFWRPSLTVDHHGVVWMFYLNTTRRHVYWTRFQGDAFDRPHEARGAYDDLSRVLLLQKDTRQQRAIGYVTLAAGELYFDAIEAPSYTSTDARRVVFLDNLEVDRVQQLEHRTGQWQRHPEPVFGWGVTGHDDDDHTAWCQAHAVEGGFELHYMGRGRLRNTQMPGRAFSHDGLHWQVRAPVDADAQTIDGEPFPDSFWRPLYLRDEDEPDPQRRYKGLLGRYRFDRDIEQRTWVVVTSADATHWRTAPELPLVVHGDISVPFHLYRDDDDDNPDRRYKFSVLMGACAGRAVVVFTSPDLLHWQRVVQLREDPDVPTSAVSPYATGPIAIDPDGGESPWEEEVHDGVLWREHGALMMHYDAFHFGANQHVDKALAVSRDGRHYWRIARGAINLPHGACGDWDSGRVRTSVPVRVGDEWWLYYCGMPAGHFSDPDAQDDRHIRVGAPSPADHARYAELRPWRVGLARLRAEGWAYWQLPREAEQGTLITIPFDYDRGGLVVNGAGLGHGLAVEVLDTEMQPVPGFDARSASFSATDSVNAHVSWDAASPLAPGRYRLRFVFTDLRARLYAFGFE